MGDKRFRIAFSFAGEKRDFVADIAAILAKQFGQDAILYDKFHSAEFSRSDLAFYLPDLYETRADLVVVVFCPDYENKEWCGLEWNAIFGLLKARKAGGVMLTRFQQIEGKGLRGLAGYTDLDNLTPQQAADLILERLAINKGLAEDHYKSLLPNLWCGRANPLKLCLTPNARWKSSSGLAHPDSKTPARRWPSAKPEHSTLS